MSQSKLILRYMQRGRSIDPMVALRLFATMRLAARIRDLRKGGVKINRTMVRARDDRRYARYTLQGVSATRS